jgi:DNA repair protein RecO (recombination protein O)
MLSSPGSPHGRDRMPLKETEAIILRTYPLGEADRIVSFLSRSEGRLRGVAQGARRPRSRFGGLLEPLSHVRLWFYERETRSLVRISEGELLESFLELQSNYELGLALATIAEISELVFPEHEPVEPAFRLILAVAREMRSSHRSDVPLVYFLLWVVRLSGWLPSFRSCGRCKSELSSSQPAWGASTALLCSQCAAGQGYRLPPDERNLALNMLRQPLSDFSGLEKAQREAKNLRLYLKSLIEHHTERSIQTLQMEKTG